MEWFPMCDFLSKVTFVQFLFVQLFISLKCLKLNENDEKKRFQPKKGRHKTNMEKRVRKNRIMHLEWLNNWCCWIAPDSFYMV